MKWPWVSRLAYDHEVQRHDQLIARHETLLDKYHALKLAGAQPAPPASLPLARKERDDVYDAIELQSGSDPTLKRHLTRWAGEQRLLKAGDTDIINQILHWQSGEDDEDLSQAM